MLGNASTGTNNFTVGPTHGAYNLSAANLTVSSNATHTIVCLNAIDNATVSYVWQNYSGQSPLNISGWNSWSGNSSATNGSIPLPTFNLALNMSGANTTLNITGCNPVVVANSTNASAELANCPFFAGNTNTTFVPHDGFTASNGSWVPTNNTPWHPGQFGYLPSDSVFYATVGFVNAVPNVTYEAAVSFAGATPIPQVFFLNTGIGGNETVTFVFDMTAAWYSALPGGAYGYNVTAGNDSGFYSDVYAAVDTFSVTVSQCYIDASGLLACPDTIGTVAP
ncbi:MAG: hypothetical protein ACLQD8_03010 [Thermoplasmata archaeon]